MHLEELEEDDGVDDLSLGSSRSSWKQEKVKGRGEKERKGEREWEQK